MLDSLYRALFFFADGLLSRTHAPSGGSEATGAATVSFTGGTGFGGSESGGSGTTYLKSQSWPSSAIAGGSESGGSATIATQLGSSGGSEAGGSDTVIGMTLLFYPSGGSEVGGAAQFSIGVTQNVVHTPTGGSEAAGAAPFAFDQGLEFTPSGGSEAGGTATYAQAQAFPASALLGGSEAGGTVPYVWQPAGYMPNGGSESGNADVGSETPFTRGVNHTPSGGSQSGGTAHPAGEGGSESGGSALVGMTYLIVPTAGSEAGGSAANGVTYATHGGGSESGGTASVIKGAPTFTHSGGSESGGAAPFLGLVIPLGGSEAGGSATIATGLTQSVTPTGGSEATGFATVRINSAIVSTSRHRGPTTRRNVLRAIQRGIVAGTSFSIDRVYIPRRRDEQDISPPGEPYVTILLGRQRVEQPDFAGGGLESDTRLEVIEVRVHQMLEFDQYQRATEWELHEVKGAQTIVLNVTNAIHGEEAFDNAGTCLTGQPMRVLDIGDIQPSRQPGWGYVPISLEVLFTAAEVSA